MSGPQLSNGKSPGSPPSGGSNDSQKAGMESWASFGGRLRVATPPETRGGNIVSWPPPDILEKSDIDSTQVIFLSSSNPKTNLLRAPRKLHFQGRARCSSRTRTLLGAGSVGRSGCSENSNSLWKLMLPTRFYHCPCSERLKISHEPSYAVKVCGEFRGRLCSVIVIPSLTLGTMNRSSHRFEENPNLSIETEHRR